MKVSPYLEYKKHGLTVPIRLRRPLFRMLLFTLVAAAFTFVGIWGFFTAEDILKKVMSIIVMVFGGAGLRTMLPFLTTSYIAVFDREGLCTTRYAVKILWTDVQAVGILVRKGYESLCIAVEDYEKYKTQLSDWALLMHAITHTLIGRLGVVILVTAFKPGKIVEAMYSLSDMKRFDFVWSHHEFPSMRIREVKEIIEIQSRNARGIS